MAQKKTTIVQKIGWVYAALFFLVVLMNYIPGIHDSEGLMYGLFKLDLIDDLLHIGSGLWAGIAAYHSHRASAFYFKTFGTMYFLDGVLGIVAGKGYLDFAIFTAAPAIADMGTRIAANIPHIGLGGSAMIIGFILSKRLSKNASSQ